MATPAQSGDRSGEGRKVTSRPRPHINRGAELAAHGSPSTSSPRQSDPIFPDRRGRGPPPRLYPYRAQMDQERRSWSCTESAEQSAGRHRPTVESRFISAPAVGPRRDRDLQKALRAQAHKLGATAVAIKVTMETAMPERPRVRDSIRTPPTRRDVRAPQRLGV